MRSELLCTAAAVLLSTCAASAQPQTPTAAGVAPPAGAPAPVSHLCRWTVLADDSGQPAPGCAPGCATAPAYFGPPGRWDGDCYPDEHFYGSAEYLLWWIGGYGVPPLVTTGPAQFPVGYLGNPGTRVLFGGSSLNPDALSGARFTVGAWLGECRRCGVEADYFFLGERNAGARFDSPVLARPFTNANTGGQFSEFAAFPGISTGSIDIGAPTQLWGAGARVRRPLCCGCWGNVDLLSGFQFLSLSESLTVTESAAFQPGGPFPALAGSSFTAVDRFGTANRFYGGQVGLDARLRRGGWVLGLRALVALGFTHQEVDVQGFQHVTDPTGRETTVPGGLLALPGANIGRVERDSFTVIPQVGLTLGYQITERVTLFAGYNFLYWSSVVRPGEQIDPVLDVNRIPNFVTDPAAVVPPRPANPFNRSGLWVHGLSFGVGVRW